jgi:hypothetical protein
VLVLFAIAASLLVGCAEWEAYRHERVESGYWVTLAQPMLDGAPAEGATTLCVAREKLRTCPRSSSLAYIFRPQRLRLVIAGKSIELQVDGGDIRRGPSPGQAMTIGDQDELTFRIVRQTIPES